MQYRRVRIEGAVYFFTVNLLNRSDGFLIKELNLLINAIKITKFKYPFKIFSYVILPDHIHMIMVLPPNDSNYSQRWSMIKAQFSKQIQTHESISPARRKKRERAIWQRRFWEHLIRDDFDLEQHVNYIHYNPVKHGYVNEARDWMYSSIHSYIKRGLLPKNWSSVNSPQIILSYGE